MTPLLPAPSAADLIDLRAHAQLSAEKMPALFGLADGRAWRRYEAGIRKMDAARYSLGLLLLGLHPTHRLIEA